MTRSTFSLVILTRTDLTTTFSSGRSHVIIGKQYREVVKKFYRTFLFSSSYNKAFLRILKNSIASATCSVSIWNVFRKSFASGLVSRLVWFLRLDISASLISKKHLIVNCLVFAGGYRHDVLLGQSHRERLILTLKLLKLKLFSLTCQKLCSVDSAFSWKQRSFRLVVSEFYWDKKVAFSLLI